MLDKTSWSSKPNARISYILARATNLSSRKGRSICLSQNETDIQNGSHQNIVLSFPNDSCGSSSPPHSGSVLLKLPVAPPPTFNSGSTPQKQNIGLWCKGG